MRRGCLAWACPGVEFLMQQAQDLRICSTHICPCESAGHIMYAAVLKEVGSSACRVFVEDGLYQ